MVKPIAPVPAPRPRPPLGLRPRCCVSAAETAQARRHEILAAMTRYSQAGKQIPARWIDELIDLNSPAYYEPR